MPWVWQGHGRTEMSHAHRKAMSPSTPMIRDLGPCSEPHSWQVTEAKMQAEAAVHDHEVPAKPQHRVTQVGQVRTQHPNGCHGLEKGPSAGTWDPRTGLTQPTGADGLGGEATPISRTTCWTISSASRKDAIPSPLLK